MIEARTIGGPGTADLRDCDCAGCGGAKGASLAGVVTIRRKDNDVGFTFALCDVCGRDAANAIGFLCIRDGGWSKLEPRRKSSRPQGSTT